MKLFNNIKSLRWLVGILFLLNIVLIGTLWMGRKVTKGDFHKGKFVEKFLARKLDLDENQTKLFKAERKEHFKTLRHIQQERRDIKDKLLEAASEEIDDKALVDSLKNEMLKIEDRRLELTITHFRALKSICTPEQVEKLEEIIDKTFRGRGFR